VIAIQLRTRYCQCATLKKIYSLTAFIWILSLVISCVWIWNVTLHQIIKNVFLFPCIVVASISYIRVFMVFMMVRRHQVGSANIQPQMNSENTRFFHLGKYKRFVTSAVYVFCFFLLCYLPYSCLSIITRTSERGSTLSLCVDVAALLVFANSSLNPVLYCWRIPEIRQIIKETFGKLFCKKS